MKNTPKNRPAEYGTPGVAAFVFALLVAIGSDPDTAMKWAAVVAAAAPGVISFSRERGWL